MKTADGYPLRTGDEVYTRCGDCYPVPGRWRVRHLRVAKRSDTRVRLESDNPKHRCGCWRKPEDIYHLADVARGLAPNTAYTVRYWDSHTDTQPNLAAAERAVRKRLVQWMQAGDQVYLFRTKCNHQPARLAEVYNQLGEPTDAAAIFYPVSQETQS